MAGDLTIDEVMALGEKHTEAMKPKKRKKKKAPVQEQKGLAESVNVLQDATKSLMQTRQDSGNGLSGVFNSLFKK